MAIGNAFNSSGGTGNNNTGSNLNIEFEDLTSLVNGSRVEFQTSKNYDANSLIVYINGLRQRQNTIGQTGNNSFTVPTAPEAGDVLEVRYTFT